MRFRRCSRELIVVAVVAFAAGGSAAAKDVAKVIPPDALGFVVVNRMAEIDAKAEQLSKLLEVPVPGPLASLKSLGGVNKGLDDSGTAAVALLPGEAGGPSPSAVVYLPVADYEEFLAQLAPERDTQEISKVRLADKPMLAARKDGFAVLVEPKHRAALENVLESSESVAGSLAGLGPYLAKQDVAGVVTSDGVKLLVALGHKGLAEARKAIEALDQPENPAADVIGLYSEMLRGIGREVDTYAVGARLEKDGVLHLTNRVTFNPSGKVAPLLREAEPYRGDLLAGLPRVPFVAAAAGVFPPEAFEPMMDFSGALMKAAPQLYNLTPEQVDKVIRLSKKSLVGYRGMSFLLGAGRPGAPLYSSMVGIIFVDDAEEYLANYRKFGEEMARLGKEMEGSFVGNMKMEAVEVEGNSGVKVVMEMPVAFLGPKPEEAQDAMEKLFGPGGKMTAYLVPADEHTVVMSYTDTQLLTECIKAIETGERELSDAKEVQQTLSLLPEGAQGVALFSPEGAIAFLNRAMGLAPEAKEFQLPDFPESPPVGWAAKAMQGSFETDVVVPAEVLRAIGRYVEEVKQHVAKKQKQKAEG